MKITIYDLLGMMKRENPPIKILYRDIVYNYDKEQTDYLNDDEYLIETLFDEYIISSVLNKEVIIIETEVKLNDVPQLEEMRDTLQINQGQLNGLFKYKINEIIRYIRGRL